jgi:DNA (cytosine-5)-methyltransferase 1
MTDLIIDSFAGGGGASLGITWATGRCPDIAINHDRDALTMHAENHPRTEHVLEDVWRADLKQLTKGRPVGLLWASPDCRHFSRAKGGQPVSKRVRSLAWIVCKWAAQVRPRVICLENVREFAEWGPIVPQWKCRECGWKGTEGQATLVRTRLKCPRCDGRKLVITEQLVPCPNRKGLTFKRWVGRLKGLGYQVEWRNMDAADYGAPTHRKRLFLVARCDGETIQWPEPSHGKSRLPYRTAAECIDWDVPCPSIFDRQRPLAEKTLRRIALGIKRYVLEAATPFIVPITHVGDRKSYPLFDPLPTITTAHRGELALIAPTLVQTGYGERAGQSPRTLDINQPLGTVVGSGKHAIAVPVLSSFHHSKSTGDSRCRQLDLPFPTLDTQPRLSLVSAFLAKHFGGQVGQAINEPAPTATVRSTQQQIVAANLVRFNFDDAGVPITAPLPTSTLCNHMGMVYSFLIRYFGTAIGQHVTEPMFTVTGKDRFGLVTVQVNGEPYVIVDIGMRMLTPRELARAQGFPDTYILRGTKTSQVARIGNSVCPAMAKAVVAANIRSGVMA